MTEPCASARLGGEADDDGTAAARGALLHETPHDVGVLDELDA
jgi:hypothetical protein